MAQHVLITGGAGFIGSALADRLAAEGNHVLVLDTLARAGAADNLAWLRRRHPRHIAVAHGDIRDGAVVADCVAGTAGVFHLAAQAAVSVGRSAPLEDFEINLRGTVLLLDALRRRGDAVPLVFAGTTKVYGDLADIPLDLCDDGWQPADTALRAAGVDERRRLDFHTPHGCSKGAADQYVLDAARSFGLPSVVLRMSTIYGMRQCGTPDQGWLTHFLLAAMTGGGITLYGDGHQVRDLMFVDDAVDACLAAWRRAGDLAGRAFNLGGGPDNAVSLLQLVGTIERLLGRPVARRMAPARADDRRWFVTDARAARAALDLPAPLPWRQGLARLAAWADGAQGRAVRAA